MLRIMTSDQPTCTLIAVDGQLLGEYLDTVENCCIQATSKGKPVQLFLRDVPIIGEDGWRLLHRLAAKGIGMKASGIYTSYVVDLIQNDELARAQRRG